MPESDRIETTLAAMREAWFFGPLEGPGRARFLREAVDRHPDRRGLEAALSLGGHPLPIESQKRKRQAQRALLLVDFALRQKPLALRSALLKQSEALPLDALVRAVKAEFPAYPERDGKRMLWATERFTDPARCSELERRQDWTGKPIPSFRFVIHAIPENKAKLTDRGVFRTHWEPQGHGRFEPRVEALADAPEILRDPAQKLRSRLAISASVISSQACAPYANLGLILRVPPLNILTTSPEDQWFDNRAGTAQSRDALVRPTDMAALIQHTGWAIGDLMSPEEVLELTGQPGAIERRAPGGKNTRHNEVVVCGRPGHPIGAGLSGSLEVAGFFLLIGAGGDAYHSLPLHPRVRPSTEANWRDAARRLGLPLLYLPFVAPGQAPASGAAS